jgi:hypothetical protein
MNLYALQDPAQVREYVGRKFSAFKSSFMLPVRRRSKCIEYWLNARGNRQVVEDVYGFVFKQAFPKTEALQKEQALNKKYDVHKTNSTEWVEKQEKQAGRIGKTVDRLKQWEQQGDYQEGEDFFLRLKTEVEPFDESLCDPRQFSTEHEAQRRMNLTGATTRTANKVGAEFDGMVGYQQKAGATFQVFDPRFGQLVAKFEEEFKAGLWGSGSWAATKGKTSLSVEAAAELAIGAQLTMEGKCEWKSARGKAGLELGGRANVFAGARGSAAMKLSASAQEGIEATISAGAFVGLSASIEGSCSILYDDRQLASVNASAEITFGAGVTFAASLKQPIFGATEISFDTSVTLGFGTGVAAQVEIDFSEIYLAGQEQFRNVIYLPTIAKGYSPSLMTQDLKNKHYLKKAITMLGSEQEEIEETVVSVKNMDPEKQPFLM